MAGMGDELHFAEFERCWGFGDMEQRAGGGDVYKWARGSDGAGIRSGPVLPVASPIAAGFGPKATKKTNGRAQAVKILWPRPEQHPSYSRGRLAGGCHWLCQ